VRPEHITLSPPSGPRAGNASISLVEPMGSNQIVWLADQGMLLAVEADAQFAPMLDRRIDFAIDAAQVSLFDPASGRRL
jgi:multiple sugar transport system ATP-binding protein